MKKYSTILLLVSVVSITVFGNVVFRSVPAHAVDSSEAPVMALEEPLMIESTDGGVMKEKSDYVLPYPGILPDHPLYFLKDLRDKIIEMLIVDPERKAEFYLLQSDKFLNATQSLLDKDQTEKAKMVLMQSSERMTKVVSELSSLKANGREVTADLLDRVTRAMEKHAEMLTDMSSKIETTDASTSLQKTGEELMKLK